MHTNSQLQQAGHKTEALTCKEPIDPWQACTMMLANWQKIYEVWNEVTRICDNQKCGLM